jgi:hypothetical protein
MRAKNCARSVGVTVHRLALKEVPPVHWRSRQLANFIQHEVLDGRCIDYLRAVSEEENEMGLEDANDLAKYLERLVEGQRYEVQQPDDLLEGLEP